MRDLRDRAAHLGGVLALDDLVHLVQPKTDKDLALAFRTADRRADLLGRGGASEAEAEADAAAIAE